MVEAKAEVAVSDGKEKSAKVEKASAALVAAQELLIESMADIEHATDMLAYVKKYAKAVDAERTALVRPLNDHVKSINARFKEITGPLEEAEMVLKSKMAAYLKKRAMEQEEKTDGGAAANAVPVVVQGNYGTTSTRERWNFEVQDISKVPLGFLAVDEKLVREAINEGRRCIPGLRIFRDDIIVNR
jgi:hypothetical protein